MAFSAARAVPAGPNDITVAEPPRDSISSLAFSSQADFLAAGSWDNSVRIYQVTENGQSQGKAMYEHQGPVLSVCWNKTGDKLFSGGADNAGRMFDIATGQMSQVAQHDAPIKTVRWVDTQSGLLATGSWDQTIKYWDLRTQNPVATVNLHERCYTFDVQYPLMVVGTAGLAIQIFNLNNPTTPVKTMPSPLKHQTRIITCPPSSQKPSFIVGSIEGRVAVQYTEEKDISSNFSFRCHRADVKDGGSLVYAVNDISVHPVQGTVSTCGSDGLIHFWDTEARMRLKSFEAAPGPISCSTFNRNGNIFAYAVSYDWHKGHTGMTPTHPNKIMLHACLPEEITKKSRR
ncbi:WD40-repeat-containing domain protein [Mycena floridula]|nr:WD40-repeat-containing domain protein [Mycena floridula]